MARFARLAALTLALLAAWGASAPAAGPGLVVRALSGPDVSVWQGQRIGLSDTTANAAPTWAPAAVTTYRLERGSKRIVLGRRYVRSLPPGGVSRGMRTVTLRYRVSPGIYRLVACAAPRRAATPRRGPHCRTAARRLKVLDARPVSTGAPRLTGQPLDRQTLNATTGRWLAPPPTFLAMRWQRCAAAGCTDVPGATSLRYTLTPDDVGLTMRVVVTARSRAGMRFRQSARTATVAGIPPVNTAPPAIGGVALTGLTVSAANGTWDGTPPLAYAYQWQHCDATGTACTDIAGATGGDHVVGGQDAPMLRLTVTASGRGGTTTAYSAPVPAGSWRNPVYDAAPVPDPFVLDVDGAHRDYYSFNTGGRFPMRHSADLVHWQPAGTALDARPAWAIASGDSHPWAPSVLQTPAACPGQAKGPCFVMYYVSLSAQYGVNCVAVATSPTPGGPYSDRGPLADPAADPASEPIGCGDDQGQGNIDPSPFTDQSGDAWLYVSTDRPAPTISAIPLSQDRLAAAGARTPLFTGDAGTWEAAAVGVPTVEGPFAVQHAGTYYVFYSGGGWRTHYGMGYATGPAPTGPFTKSARNPILAETPAVASPGGGDLPVTGPRGGSWLAYHGRDTVESNPRTLRLDRFDWRPAAAGGPDEPVIAGPSVDPQPELP